MHVTKLNMLVIQSETAEQAQKIVEAAKYGVALSSYDRHLI